MSGVANGLFLKRIQSSAQWQKFQFGDKCKEPFGRKFAERACRLSWAFNAKPDLVLHLAENRAICIEAKLESKIATYSSKPAHCQPFSMKQTEIQEFILNDLPGYQTRFVAIDKKPRAAKDIEAWIHCAWKDVFDALMHAKPAQSHEFSLITELLASPFIQPRTTATHPTPTHAA
ncbi:MAG TPA: hypothetical protein VFN29_04770 [Chiayiivirga sp.]|nr:hypothetical protein [Chiayiivirga sp.]